MAFSKSKNSLGLEQRLEFVCEASLFTAVLSLVEIRGEQVSSIVGGSESFGEHLILGNQFAFGGRGAVNLLNNFVEFDPTVLGGRFISGNSHDERNKTVGTGTGNGRIVDEGVAEGNGFRHISFVVSREEKVKGHVGISSVILLVDLGSVGINIVGLDHTLGSQDFGTLIVSERGLTADIDHGLNPSGVSDNAGSSVVFFRTIVLSDFHIDVGGANGEDIDGVGTSQESSHIEIVDGHIGEDTAATLDVGSWRRSGITGAQFDLHRDTQTQYQNRAPQYSK